MRLTYLGHSCVLLSGSRRVIVDPFIPGGEPPRHIDIIAVTHGHADHMGDAARLGKPVIAINEIAKYLNARGVPAEGFNIGGSVECQGVRFTLTQAVHSAWLEEAGPGVAGGAAAGLIIVMDGCTVYHAGDTALFSDMRLIGDLYHPDVALLPIGGRYTMGPAEAMMAAQLIGAPLVIPVHYNTWPVIRQDPVPFREALERTTDVKVRILAAGESCEIEPGENS